MLTFGNNGKRWFIEHGPLWPGRALAIELERELFSGHSKYQRIEVFETASCGKMLVLDGVIQFTESDEFAYQEMLAHLPLCAHPRPEKVLVIGGGDGGILREVGRHECVKQIDLCEIDPMVIEVCREYVPSMGCGFDDPRVKINFEDGGAYARRMETAYNVVIVDSTDPVGPGEALFGERFHRDLRRALAPGGVVAAQGESIFLHAELVQEMMRLFATLYPIFGYAITMVPTYPGGNIGICLGSLESPVDEPARLVDPGQLTNLRYYSPMIHRSAFILPKFGQRMVEGVAVDQLHQQKTN